MIVFIVLLSIYADLHLKNHCIPVITRMFCITELIENVLDCYENNVTNLNGFICVEMWPEIVLNNSVFVFVFNSPVAAGTSFMSLLSLGFYHQFLNLFILCSSYSLI